MIQPPVLRSMALRHKANRGGDCSEIHRPLVKLVAGIFFGRTATFTSFLCFPIGGSEGLSPNAAPAKTFAAVAEERRHFYARF